jgi:hypothetical protein
MRQLGMIKSFIDDRGLSGTEPVFIAGDLNVDKYDEDEYAAMLCILDAWYPQSLGHPYTVDSTINGRAGYRLYLDYVLVSNRHLQPVDATVEALISPFSHTLGRRSRSVRSLSRVRAFHIPSLRGHHRGNRRLAKKGSNVYDLPDPHFLG